MGWVFNAPDDIATWAPRMVAIYLVFTFLSLASCCLRVYVRVFLINAFGAGKSEPHRVPLLGLQHIVYRYMKS